MSDFITFQNNAFPIRYLSLKGWGENLPISTYDLQNQLINDHCLYTNEEAQQIDEQIFFYVDNKEIKLPETTLGTLVL
jgi:hypothetical protein